MKTFFPSIFALIFSANSVQADVFVAEQVRFEVLSQAFQVKAGTESFFDIGEAGVGDRFEVYVQSENGFFPDISSYVCVQGSGKQDCKGYSKVEAPYSYYVDIDKANTYILKLDNTYSALTTKRGAVSVFSNRKLDKNHRANFVQLLSNFENQVYSTFEVENFNLNLEPCGTENAFSKGNGGHITICSELFMRLLIEQKQGALIGIFFHELGHTLLNLWGQPNWRNETTVDEFAIVMMYWEGIQERAFDWVSYFEEKNSDLEANHILKHGGPHPLSIQRARNAREILSYPSDVIKRWNRYLYPHLKNEKLRTLIDNPGVHGDRELASKILQSR